MTSAIASRRNITPVTIIGGYLGAGKTTLVNQLLRQADGLRLAVLVNDFGDLPIDADLIESQDETVINIAGGCVCCSFGSDLIAALMDIRDMDPRLEHVLIEASGVALPEAISESVGLLAEFERSSVIVMADAETVRRRSTETYFADTIERELQCADVILLNKADIATAEELAETSGWLGTDFPNAVQLQTQNATVPIHALLDPETGIHLDKPRNGQARAGAGGHPAYLSAVVEFEAGIDPGAVADRLAQSKNGLLRSKGHVQAADGAVYAVQTVWRRSEVRKSRAGVGNLGKVVVIAITARQA
ncbi:MAG: GTP-binding protein [Pseudomonadota bacterium]